MFRKSKISRREVRRKIFLVLFLVIIFFALFKGITNYGMKIVDGVFLPIQAKIYDMGIFFKDIKKAMFDYKKNLEENSQLKFENTKLKMLISYNNDLEKENERLTKLLKMKSGSKSTFMVGRVKFKTPASLYQTCFIDLGKKDGIKENMVVLYENRVLGKIRKVYDDYSSVDLITGENFNVSAMTEKNMLGIVKGEADMDGEVYFEPTTQQDTFTIGDKIYTSGISDIYPKGLYIGEISEIDTTDGELFKNIKVKNNIDIKEIREVIIMVNDKKR